LAKLEGVNVIDMRDGEITKIVYKGETYKKVDIERSEVEIGDIVRNTITRRDAAKGNYYEVVGDSFFVTTVLDDVNDGHTEIIHHGEIFRKVSAPTITDRVDELDTRVSALEAVESAKEYDKPAQVGDTILITDAYHTLGRYKNGDKLTVKKVDEENDVVATEESGHYYIDNSEFKIIGRKEAEKQPFEVGDKVRLISGGNKYPLRGFNIGGVYEVADLNYNHDDIDGKAVAIKREDGHIGYAHPSQIEKVSEADLVFIENGREPDEYRKGDIVAYDDPEWFENSGIGEVIGFSESDGIPRVKAVDFEGYVVSYYLDDKIKPVAFVESRVDVDA